MSSARYRRSQRIHTGSRFSVVRAAREDGRTVVVKLAAQSEGAARERLCHEHAILRQLRIPGVARPIDLTTVDGRPALVLEDAGPRDLAEILDGRPLGVEAFLDLAVSMARAVGRLHQSGVIHRDLCPENFVVDEAQTGPESNPLGYSSSCAVGSSTEPGSSKSCRSIWLLKIVAQVNLSSCSGPASASIRRTRY